MTALSLRGRILLIFGGLAALCMAAGVAGAVAAGDSAPQLGRIAAVAGWALAGLCAAAGVWFDRAIGQTALRLTRDLETALHGDAGQGVTRIAGPLAGLSSAASGAAEALRAAQQDQDLRIHIATEAAQAEKARLAAVLRDLHQGVVICTLDHRILFYNREAHALFDRVGPFGLGRSMLELVTPQPIRHALERLTNRLADGRWRSHRDGLSARTVCATACGGRLLSAQVALAREDDGDVTGYVVSFEDVTADIADRAQRDHFIKTELSQMRAALDEIAAAPGSEEAAKALRHIMRRLDALEADRRARSAARWPTADIWSANLFACIQRPLLEEGALAPAVEGAPCWLNCDSASVAALIESLCRLLTARGATQTAISATPSGGGVAVVLRWSGALEAEAFARWRDGALAAELGSLTANDVLERHQTEAQLDAEGLSVALTLFAPAHDHAALTPKLPPRPEFYDFDLLSRAKANAGDDRPLRSLDYVAFDTETTGLEPSKGDEMVQIAGVRIVNGRVLRGEVFDALIHPGRAIPAASTKFHGLTDAMVANAPGATTVLPQFRAFVGDAALIAHNAAFDMKFLTLKQAAAGVRFDDRPVLDTVLLSAFVHDHESDHTLDGLCTRFGIEIPAEERHTALGDSIATAAAFVRMLSLLEARGIRTLAQAQAASEKAVAIRKQQARY